MNYAIVSELSWVQMHMTCSCCPNLSVSSEAYKNVFSYALIYWLVLAKVFNNAAACEGCVFSHAGFEVLLCSRIFHKVMLKENIYFP